MASKNADAWLWVVLAVVGYYAAGTVHKQLAGIRKDSEITRHEKPPDMLGPGTVNALKLDTLSQLTRSPNPDIRAASIKIITERLFHEESTWTLLLQDLKGLNTERRDKALMTFRSIAQFTQPNLHMDVFFHHPHTYDSIIICLMNLLPQAQIAETNSTYRSQAERDSIWLLCSLLLPANPRKADVIGRWLSMYPFGGRGSTLAEKRTIVRSIAMGQYVYKDCDFGYYMRSVLASCFRSHCLCMQLKKLGLCETREDTEQLNDITLELNNRKPQGLEAAWEGVPVGAVRTNNGWTIGTEEYPDAPGLDAAWIPVGAVRGGNGWTFDPEEFPDETDLEEDWHESIPEGAIRTREGYLVRTNARGIEQSPEEQRLRRRRREAMVLGENGRPIQRQDIIEPNAMNLDGDNVDDDLEPLMEEIAREADEETLAELRAENDRSWWGWLGRLRPDGLAPIHSS